MFVGAIQEDLFYKNVTEKNLAFSLKSLQNMDKSGFLCIFYMSFRLKRYVIFVTFCFLFDMLVIIV
ncbi:hypothetical protein DHL47_02890 [Streptococcus panodentis]|uniref:Uncharacterized protein n=1 Tax=Streptococcus panodentis TaxID=1581472 RepID=A0ABS5AUN6_9STRE|nr:hypothetical protein [Streptococcus panodentis]